MEQRTFKLCVAVLDTMWTGERRHAPRYFQINPNNHSGKRLYKLVGTHYHIYVTNACTITGIHANEHGTPDPMWLKENLERLYPIDLLLLCGNVAQQTFDSIKMKRNRDNIHHIVRMLHPAARTWTKDKLAHTQKLIERIANGQ